MVFDSRRFDLQPYAGLAVDHYVRRTRCSWTDLGWQSLLVQRFDHVPVVEEMELPAAADVHLILPVAGRAVMEKRSGGRSGGGRWSRRTWRPGRIEPGVPGRAVLRRYRGFSDRPREPGWNPARTARAWAELMTVLGYERFGAHGGG